MIFGKTMNRRIFFVLMLIFMAALSRDLCAQTQAANPSAGFDMSAFPQWARDLRRGEIVAFGSFPFTFFFTSFFVDTYRTATHNWDTRYAPWPVKSAGAVDMTRNQVMLTIGVAAGSAVLIALADHFIVRYNRNRETQEILGMPPGTPIITRRPMYADGPDIGAGEGGPEPARIDPVKTENP